MRRAIDASHRLPNCPACIFRLAFFVLKVLQDKKGEAKTSNLEARNLMCANLFFTLSTFCPRATSLLRTTAVTIRRKGFNLFNRAKARPRSLTENILKRQNK